MHHVVYLSLAALALLALAPVVAGDSCLPACEVRTIDAGARWAYVPAATFVGSGSTVSWSALDTVGHSATDRASNCFNVSFAGPAVRGALFFTSEGKLFASVDGKPAKRCSAATSLPDGSFLLRYECTFHAGAMEGVLVVK